MGAVSNPPVPPELRQLVLERLKHRAEHLLRLIAADGPGLFLGLNLAALQRYALVLDPRGVAEGLHSAAAEDARASLGFCMGCPRPLPETGSDGYCPVCQAEAEEAEEPLPPAGERH